MSRKVVITTKQEYDRYREHPEDYEDTLVVLAKDAAEEQLRKTHFELLNRRINQITMVPSCLRSEEDKKKLCSLMGES